MTKRPVGLTRKSLAQLVGVEHVRRQHRQHDVLPQVVEDLVARRAVVVLRGDQQLLDRRRARRRSSAPRPASCRPGAGSPASRRGAPSASCLASWWASEIGSGMSSGGLVRRVAEHHPLVARAGDVELVVVVGVGLRLVGLIDALRDVRRLLVDRVEHGARVRREAQIGVDVADPADRLARDLLDVDERLGRDLAGDDDEAGVHQRLAGDATRGVVAHDGIQHAIGDLVGDLVGMALGHRLGGEEVLVLGEVGHARKASGHCRGGKCARYRGSRCGGPCAR